MMRQYCVSTLCLVLRTVDHRTLCYLGRGRLSRAHGCFCHTSARCAPLRVHQCGGAPIFTRGRAHLMILPGRSTEASHPERLGPSALRPRSDSDGTFLDVTRGGEVETFSRGSESETSRAAVNGSVQKYVLILITIIIIMIRTCIISIINFLDQPS